MQVILCGVRVRYAMQVILCGPFTPCKSFFCGACLPSALCRSFFFGSVYAQQVKFGVPLRYAGHFVGSV